MIRPTAIRSFQQSLRSSRPAFKPEFQPHLGRITPGTLKSWIPTLAIWGGAGGGALMLFASPIPLFQHDILLKIPLIKEYYTDKTPDSDKPF
ncbi:unnamed protein product [Sympodiomycopsis kandeliae]